LHRESEIVTAEQSNKQGDCIKRGRPLRDGNDFSKIRIASQNSFGVGKNDSVDRSLRKGPLETADDRRRQEHVAEPAQDHHKHARILRQANRIHCCAIE
jgi:hypothetical protein